MTQILSGYNTDTLTVIHTVIFISEQRSENMSKSLEELQREYEKNTVKLEQEKRKLRRLENRKSYLDSGSRKQRSHRLITRGAAIESVMPEVKILTEQEFYSLMERIAEWQPVQNMVRLAVENHSQPQDGN